MSARDRILDGCDLETFIVCDAVEEGKSLGLRLMAELGSDDADVVFCERGTRCNDKVRSMLSIDRLRIQMVRSGGRFY